MSDSTFQQAVAEICVRDSRYASESYCFLREALDATVKALKKPAEGLDRHVTGRELCEGFRDLALQEFGPLALTVLHAWGIQRTEDIGEIVFNLVDAGKLGKTEKDSRRDFANIYDFHETFAKPYQAPAPAPALHRSRRKSTGKR